MKPIEAFIYSPDIKLIVFDLHGTLTNRTSIHPYHISYRNQYIKYRTGIEVPENLPMTTDEAFDRYSMLDKHQFYQQRDHDPLFDFSKIHQPIECLKEKLQGLTRKYTLVLHSDSYRKQIERTLEAIDLTDIFDEIVSIENSPRKIADGPSIFSSLCEGFGLDMTNILMLGDRLDKDINPCLKLGGNALRVESSDYLMEAIETMSAILSDRKINSISA